MGNDTESLAYDLYRELESRLIDRALLAQDGPWPQPHEDWQWDANECPDTALHLPTGRRFRIEVEIMVTEVPHE